MVSSEWEVRLMKLSTKKVFFDLFRMQWDVNKWNPMELLGAWSIIEKAAQDEVLLGNQLARIEESSYVQ